jgi:hypothetical protein
MFIAPNFFPATQDPVQADPMMKVQTELDETKIILGSILQNYISAENFTEKLSS